MSSRWTPEAVLALAPDDSSRRGASGATRPVKWSGTGASADLIWGLYAGSGGQPYQIVVELAGPAYKCSCPSRKLPCKHALGLLLTWANGDVPDTAEAADYAAAWLGDRRARAARASARATSPGGEAQASPADAEAARKREAATAARRAQRAERVAGGLSELEEWLRDQVRVGLPASVSAGPGTGRGRPGSGRHADVMAARMNDAQAKGLAGALHDLSLVPLSGDGWPGRLLAGYAQLHLLIRAHERIGELPPGLAATVRSRIGYETTRADVLAGQPPVPGRWLVTGVRDIPDASVPTRRIWLHGQETGRPALLLAFAAPGGAWNDPDTAMLPLGTELRADLHYYPGDPPLRALAGARQAAPGPATAPPAAGGVGALLAAWSAGVAADPWQSSWPALVAGTPVAPALDDGPWHLVDADGAALPLRYGESLWTLLAISGGHPVPVAGELTPDGLTPLTAWHGRQAVALS
ncbi:MAG TPA: SWIM zinc finger family protein [Trebonia sp.]|jgi:hypothetical protein|nr:SWIM zinc finger family protein [Trebonia sp.]